MFEKEYRLNYFKEKDYKRRICRKCGSAFWSLTEDEICGDTPCTEYSFIGNPSTKKGYDVDRMRNTFLTFFESKKHSIVKRYPVVARWRDDVFLVNASIYDFQPLVTSGLIKPPANPLVVSQPCIRLTDVDLVGRSGKHLTTFEMMGHHAFNSKDETIYWKEETLEYCNDFFTDALGVKKEKIVYKEHPWFGGGNAGPSLEVIIDGLEVATLVFMNLKEDENGKLKINNVKYSPLPLNVVDTGYGLERMTWLSNGAPTIYDAIYPDFIRKITEGCGISHELKDEKYSKLLSEYAKLSGIIEIDTGSKISGLRKKVVKRLKDKGYEISMDELVKTLTPIETIYAIADHSRCLAFMLGDGIVPSNIKAGYLARLIIRRTLRLMNDVKVNAALSELVMQQIELLKDFPELMENSETIIKILDIETGKYRDTVKKGSGIVLRSLEKLGKNTSETLVNLYDTYGIHPTLAKKIAKEHDVEIHIPDAFHSMLAERHSKPEKTQEKKEQKIDQPPTIQLFYDDSYLKEFDAVVLYVKGKEVVLDRTAFYPEGGGQPSDTGVLTTKDKIFNVTNAQKIGNVIMHTVDGKINVGEVVHARVNWSRRVTLMRHHTATHIILGASRTVLGKHVWQSGAQKGIERSRVDISHYTKITDQELREIEMLANLIVMENMPIETTWMERGEAEKKYGFRLYQGGVPPGEKIRVVRTADFDVEACAGTHCKNTSEVGPIKILGCERIQDGVERIEFAAGIPALKNIQKMETILKDSCSILSVLPDKLPKTVKRFFEEWKSLNKKLDEQKDYYAGLKAKTLMKDVNVVKGVKIVSDISKSDIDELVTLAKTLIKKENVITILGSDKNGGKIVIARSKNVNIDCSSILKDAVKLIGGRGGGSKDFAQGGGVLEGNISDAIKIAKNKIKEVLGDK
jgi:alanyl-tRNA synthetase